MKAYDMCIYEDKLIPPMDLPDDYFTGIFQVIFSEELPEKLEMKLVSDTGEVPLILYLRNGKYSYKELDLFPVLIEEILDYIEILNLPKDSKTYVLQKREPKKFGKFCMENNMSIILGY